MKFRILINIHFNIIITLSSSCLKLIDLKRKFIKNYKSGSKDGSFYWQNIKIISLMTNFIYKFITLIIILLLDHFHKSNSINKIENFFLNSQKFLHKILITSV